MRFYVAVSFWICRFGVSHKGACNCGGRSVR